jgi:hypothetical protein
LVAFDASKAEEVSVMFKWLRSRRGKQSQDVTAKTEQADRDSGEEDYQAEEELEEEVAPSGMTRLKTDDI